MLNLIVAKPAKFRWRSTDENARTVPENLLRLVFGIDSLVKPMGLYAGAVVGEPIELA